MSEIKNRWEWNKTVHFYETSATGKLKPNLLAAYLQEIAWMHAEHLGFSAVKMAKRNHFWALTRMEIHVLRLPKWNEKLEIYTWPRSPEGIFALRDFEIHAYGETVASASSTWVILDGEKRRPVTPDFSHLGSDFFLSKRALSKEIKKIKVPKHPAHWSIQHAPEPAEIDLNGHVNNTEYLRWMWNALNKAQVRTSGAFVLTMNFTGEVFEGDELINSLYLTESGAIFTVEVSTKVKTAFVGEVIF